MVRRPSRLSRRPGQRRALQRPVAAQPLDRQPAPDQLGSGDSRRKTEERMKERLVVVSERWWKREGGVISWSCNTTTPAVGAVGGDYAMTKDIGFEATVPSPSEDWFDPLEA